MDNIALLAHPSKGSLWPQAITALGKLLDHDVKCKAFDVESNKLVALVDKLRAEKYAGAVVATPHKRAALALGGAVSGEAKALGALNCLKFEKTSVKGHNVEAMGFYDALSETGFKARESVCQILGAGVSGRAAAYALGRAGAKHVKVWSRKTEQAEMLTHEMRMNWPDTLFSAGPAGPAGLWVNATPLGQPGHPDKPPVKALAGAVVVIDFSYGRETKFLGLGGEERARCLSGLPILAYQAIRCWEVWFGPVGGPGRGQLKSDLMRLKRWR